MLTRDAHQNKVINHKENTMSRAPFLGLVLLILVKNNLLVKFSAKQLYEIGPCSITFTSTRTRAPSLVSGVGLCTTVTVWTRDSQYFMYSHRSTLIVITVTSPLSESF